MQINGQVVFTNSLTPTSLENNNNDNDNNNNNRSSWRKTNYATFAAACNIFEAAAAAGRSLGILFLGLSRNNNNSKQQQTLLHFRAAKLFTQQGQQQQKRKCNSRVAQVTSWPIASWPVACFYCCSLLPAAGGSCSELAQEEQQPRLGLWAWSDAYVTGDEDRLTFGHICVELWREDATTANTTVAAVAATTGIAIATVGTAKPV